MAVLPADGTEQHIPDIPDEHTSHAFQIQVTELCALNPELLDHINNVLGNAAPAPRPAPEKVTVGLRPWWHE